MHFPIMHLINLRIHSQPKSKSNEQGYIQQVTNQQMETSKAVPSMEICNRASPTTQQNLYIYMYIIMIYIYA